MHADDTHVWAGVLLVVLIAALVRALDGFGRHRRASHGVMEGSQRVEGAARAHTVEREQLMKS